MSGFRDNRIPLAVAIAGWCLACLLGYMIGRGESYRDAQPQTPPMARAAPHDHAPRSGKWPRVRAAHLADHPACAACGSRKDPQVHHVQPYHLFPELELEPSNLITLCGPGGHNCHLAYGHSMDYHAYNPHVREDAALQLRRIQQRKYERPREPKKMTRFLPGGQIAYDQGEPIGVQRWAKGFDAMQMQQSFLAGAPPEDQWPDPNYAVREIVALRWPGAFDRARVVGICYLTGPGIAIYYQDEWMPTPKDWAAAGALCDRGRPTLDRRRGEPSKPVHVPRTWPTT